MKQIAWICWWGGNALIVLAWLRKVPPTVGWCGFAIACAAFLVPGLLHRQRRTDAKSDKTTASSDDGKKP